MIRLLCLALLGTACVQDLSPTAMPFDGPDPVDPLADGFDGPDDLGSYAVTVDASHEEDWVFMDLSAPDWTDADTRWTLAFQRYRIEVNGGVSGDGDVQVAHADMAYDHVIDAPDDGWTTDKPDADDDGEPQRALDHWYVYDEQTHLLTPTSGTWFVRDPEVGTFAIEFMDYYSNSGDSGHVSLRFRALAE